MVRNGREKIKKARERVEQQRQEKTVDEEILTEKEEKITKAEEKLNELVELASQLLDTNHHFFIMSMYAVGLSSVVGLNVVKTHFPESKPEFGEFYLKSRQLADLPMGTFLRFNT